jgi:putative tryptophan/tyrosine transport system substrate-binding protein
MKRRELITLLGGVAVSWPLAARAQQPDQLRRIGIIYGIAETDLEGRAWEASFRKRLAELGWIDGRNVHVEDRWDVLVAVTTPVTAALQQETRTIPIIFTSVSDPVGGGFVASLPSPGGNITGFIYGGLSERQMGRIDP